VRRASATTVVLTTAVISVGSVALPAGRDGRHPRMIAAQRIRPGAVDSLRPASVSGDGRLIAFVASGGDSVQRRSSLNVYVLDTSTGLITPESVTPDPTRPQGDSQAPSLSADGRVIAFETMAWNLRDGDVHPIGLHVIVRERHEGTPRTPRSVAGEAPNGLTSEPVVNGSGVVVAFTSDATNLSTSEDANGQQTDVYLWRLDDSPIVRISVDGSGLQPATGASHSPSISADGELIAFVSTARLAAEDTNGVADVYLRDVRRHRTLLISRGRSGRAGDGASHSPVVSADGRHVAFVSRAGDLIARDRNEDGDIYLYDVTTGSIELVSATSRNESANTGSRRPAVSADGRYVVYESRASNLGSGPECAQPASDTNLLPDVYMLDRVTRCVMRLSGSVAQEWWTPSIAPAINGAGDVVVFSSRQPASTDDVSTDFDLFGVARPMSTATVYGVFSSR
jgi:Tol biopolymer transport system component